MVIGILLLTSIPTVTGVAQALSAQKEQENRQKDAERMKKFYVDVECDERVTSTEGLQGGRLILRNERVWIGPPKITNPSELGYVAEAFYIEYPDNERTPVPLGLVSQVKADPPLLNWIYVEKDTMELRYGNKTASIAHHVGPWDWTDDEKNVCFDDVISFVAVEDKRTRSWQLYFDMDDDGLDGYVAKNRKKVQIDLVRTLIEPPVT